MKKFASTILVLILFSTTFCLPAFADENNSIMPRSPSLFDFNLETGTNEFAEGMTTPWASTSAAVEVDTFSATVSGDKVWFGVYQSASIANPVSETKWVDTTYTFYLDYTTEQEGSLTLYLRGFGSSSNRGTVSTSGIWWG